MIKKNHSSFKQDVLRLVSGTGLAQVITVAVTPIITRLYDPEAFGVAAIFVSITGILSSVACLRYEQAIVLPKSDHSAANLLLVSIIISVFLTILTTVIIGTNEFLEWITEDIAIYSYRWLIPVVILFSGISISLSLWNTRNKNFSKIAITSVAESTVSAASKITFGLFGYAVGGSLIIANIAGKFTYSVGLAASILRHHGRFIYINANRSTMWALLQQYRRFPLYGTWSILLGNGAWLMPTILFGIFFSPEFAGLYALNISMLQIPSSLLGSAIGNVFFQKASQAHNNNTLGDATNDLFKLLTTLCVLPYMLLTVIGGDLFEFIFGSEWREAGVYAQFLAPWALLWFLSSPFTVLFSVLEKQDIQLKWNILNFTTKISSLIIAIYFDNVILAVILLGTTGAVIYGYKIFITYRMVGIPVNNAINTILKNLAFSSFPILLILIAIYSDIDPLLTLGMSFLIICTHLVFCAIQYNSQESIIK